MPTANQIPIETLIDEDRALLSAVLLGFTRSGDRLVSYTGEDGWHLQLWSFTPGRRCRRLYNVPLFAAAFDDGVVLRTACTIVDQCSRSNLLLACAVRSHERAIRVAETASDLVGSSAMQITICEPPGNQSLSACSMRPVSCFAAVPSSERCPANSPARIPDHSRVSLAVVHGRSCCVPSTTAGAWQTS